MFGIGSTEFLVIILVALIILGPKSLAKVSKTVGKYVGEFRRVSTDFQRTLNAEVAAEESKEAKAVARRAEAAKAARAMREKQVADRAASNAAEAATQAQVSAETQKPAPAAKAAQAVADEDEDDVVLAPPPGSPLDQALRKASAEAAGETPPAATGGKA